MDDTQIISLYFARRESAIAETDRKYGSYLRTIAGNILQCPEDAEEIINDTYLAAWNRIPPEYPRVLRHFLSRITRNIAFDRLDYLTAQCRDTNMITLLSELDACIPDRGSNMELVLEAKEIGTYLNHFVSMLERTDCAVFLCRYYHCMPIREIAEKHSLTERNVKYRLSCLRRSLRRFLEKEGISI